MITPTRNFAVRAIAAATLGIAALSFSSVSVAQDPGSVLSGWSGTAQLGANTSTGNSESSNINGSIRLGKTVNRWEHLVFGSLFRGRSTIVVSQEDPNSGQVSRTIVRGDNSNRLALGYQPKYYYNDSTYFFGILDWEQDEPSNVDQRTRQIIGVGHRFFSNATGFLSAEVGIGNNNTDVVVGEDLSGGIGYFGVNYLNRLNESTTFTADLRSDFGSDNTFVEFGLGLGFRVSDNLSFSINHFSRNNSDLTNTENPLNSSSDSITTFSLVFDI